MNAEKTTRKRPKTERETESDVDYQVLLSSSDDESTDDEQSKIQFKLYNFSHRINNSFCFALMP